LTLGPGRASVGSAIAWTVAFFVLMLFTASLLCLGGAVLIAGSREAAVRWLKSPGAPSMLLQAGATLASTGFFTWLIGLRRLGLTPEDLRYQRGRAARTGFGLGLLAGAGTAGLALLISVVAGGAGWVSDAGTLADYLRQSAKTIAVLAPAALSEEILFRGVPLVLLAGALGRGGALVALAIVFCFAHGSNPNVSPIGLGNIALAGIFLGLAFYAPGGIWTAFGAHLGWNSLLACLDTPVSGVPFNIPLLDYRSSSHQWLTGGKFGPEGGLAATIALTLAIVFTARWTRKAPT
jgi:uncharacterized protein